MATIEVSKNGNTLADLRFANLYQFGFWHLSNRIFFYHSLPFFCRFLLYWFIQYVFDSFRKSYLSKAGVETLVDLSCINSIFGSNPRVIALFWPYFQDIRWFIQYIFSDDYAHTYFLTLKFIYSEKATKFCEIFTLLLS